MRDHLRNLLGGAREVVLSAPVRNVSFALFLGVILAYGAAFAWYMLDRFDLVNLVRDGNYDDSWYYFQIAWYMARGEFSTFDGGLTRTNGYHPLWLFLITPFYWFFDKVEALFAIKAFEVMLVAGAVALVAGAARVARLPWILLFAALPALYRITPLFRGMEAAAAVFLLGLFLLAVCLYARDPARWRWALATVAFALPWVRLEYVAIAMAATGALCFMEWWWREPCARGALVFLRVQARVPFLAAGAGLLVYFAYNGIVFGGIVPVSGATKQWWSERRWEGVGGYSLVENVQEFLRSGFFDYELLVALEICVYVVLVWWFTRRSAGREDRLLLAFLVGVFGLAAGHLAKFVQSVLTVHPQSAEHAWYFVPAYLMLALVVPVRCFVAIWFIRRFVEPRLHRSSGIPSMGVVLLGAVFLFVKADFNAPFRSIDRSRGQISYTWFIAALTGAMVMNRVLPEGSVVGSGGSGIIGYFSRFPVMNLDGLANSWDYLTAQKERTTAEFRQAHGVTHRAEVQKTSILKKHVSALFEGPIFLSRGEKLQFSFWEDQRLGKPQDGLDRSEWFWGRIEPFMERQATGAGLLMDGRMVQAFARDCSPEELAVWTGSGPRGKMGFRHFTPWTKTGTGLCTSALVLPHDVSPPVQAAAMTLGEHLAERIGEHRPVIRADFDVYLVENRLVYVKEPCGQEDIAAPFLVHVGPVAPDDLPGHRIRYGFDNLDFRFQEYGDGRTAKVGGTCLAEVPLPDYRIGAIRTGQYVPWEGGTRLLWEGAIRPGADGEDGNGGR